MLARYIELKEVLSKIDHKKVSELLVSNADSAEVEQLLNLLEIYDSVTVELKNSATTLYHAPVIVDGVLKTYPEMDVRHGG